MKVIMSGLAVLALANAENINMSNNTGIVYEYGVNNSTGSTLLNEYGNGSYPNATNSTMNSTEFNLTMNNTNSTMNATEFNITMSEEDNNRMVYRDNTTINQHYCDNRSCINLNNTKSVNNTNTNLTNMGQNNVNVTDNDNIWIPNFLNSTNTTTYTNTTLVEPAVIEDTNIDNIDASSNNIDNIDTNIDNINIDIDMNNYLSDLKSRGTSANSTTYNYINQHFKDETGKELLNRDYYLNEEDNVIEEDLDEEPSLTRKFFNNVSRVFFHCAYFICKNSNNGIQTEL